MATHIICTGCGKVIERYEDDEALPDDVDTTLREEPDGLCPACASDDIGDGIPIDDDGHDRYGF